MQNKLFEFLKTIWQKKEGELIVDMEIPLYMRNEILNSLKN